MFWPSNRFYGYGLAVLWPSDRCSVGTEHVRWPENLSYGHTPDVLWPVEQMFYGHRIDVLRLQNMFYGPRMFFGHRACSMAIEHVLYP